MGDICFGVGEKVVFIGDSITDCGRRTEQDGPYGKGYVSLVRALLHARYPAHGLTIVNRGIGGNTIRDLAARWQEDVLNEAPDWLSVKIGINDVGRLIAGNLADHVGLDEYEATYRIASPADSGSCQRQAHSNGAVCHSPTGAGRSGSAIRYKLGGSAAAIRRSARQRRTGGRNPHRRLDVLPGLY